MQITAKAKSKPTMRVHDQIKTSQGMLPPKGAHIEAASELGVNSRVVFDLATPQEIARGEVCTMPPVTLEDLSVLLEQDVQTRRPAIKSDYVAAFAAKSGPLFAASDCESLGDWANAIILAQEVVTLQEVLNGAKPLAACERVAKAEVRIVGTGNSFLAYTASFAVGSQDAAAYAEYLPELPWLRKFRQSEGFDYAFMTLDEEDGVMSLTAFLLSFESEISAYDFAAAFSYFAEDERVVGEALRMFERDASGSQGWTVEEVLGLLSEEANLQVSDVPLDEGDFPHLQKMVHALISLHLQGVRIDVFSSAESDDFMAFDCLLSYLWYGFARKLGQVKIGYCAVCGRGFSLTGHRGPDKRFCSSECKTKEKNDRARDQRDGVRQRFLEGASVDACAEGFFVGCGKREGRARVVKALRDWRVLQHQVDAAILLRGERVAALARLLDEGVFTEEDVAARASYLKDNPRAAKAARKRVEG